MDDTRLLELASKAAGENYGHDNNPLKDDALALRLAVKLDLDVNPLDSSMWVSREFVKPKVDVEEPYGDDPYAATRRAIVRAAAEIGRTM